MAVLFSFATVVEASDNDSAFPVIFSDDFAADGAQSIQTATSLSDKWVAGQAYSSSEPCWYSIDDGFLGMAYRWNKTAAKVTPVGNAITYLPAENEISFKMAHFGGYPGRESSVAYSNGNWNSSSTIYARFNISPDGNSYFEIGKSGSETVMSQNRYPLPKSDANGKPLTDANGAVINATETDYASRFYIRKVENGVTTYIKWENNADGWFASKSSFGDGRYRSWENTAVFYKSAAEPVIQYNNWATVTIKNTASGIEYSITANKLSRNGTHTWTGSVADKSLSRKGAGFYFGCKGHETGLAIDDFSVKAQRSAEMIVPNFIDTFSGYTAQNTTANSAETAFTSISGVPQALAEGSNYNIVLSGINVGAASYDVFGGGYVDITNDKLAVSTRWQRDITANYHFTERAVDKLEYLEFTAYPGAQRMGMRTHIDSKETTSYIEFSTGRDSDGYDATKVASCTPYVTLKYGDITESFYCPTVWKRNHSASVHWSIYFDTASNTIDLTVKNETGDEWETKIKPETIKISDIEKSMKYPFAAVARGDGTSFLNNVRALITYGRIPSTFFDAFDVYTSKNSAANSEATKVSTIAGKDIEIGRIVNHKLLLSGNTANSGSAYIDVENNMLVANGNAEVKYYFPKGIKTVKSLEFESFITGGKGGVRAFKNASGTAYVEFGTDSSTNKPYVTVVDGDKQFNYSPAWSSKATDGEASVYTWTADVDGNTIEVTAKNSLGETWSEEIVYDALDSMIAVVEYPFAAFADGGTTNIFYINSALEINEYEPTFFEDFSGYTEENTVAYNEETKLIGIKLQPQLIAEKEDRKWTLSGVHVGDYDGDHKGSAYLDMANKMMAVHDRWQKGTTTKLDIKNVGIDWVSNIEFDAYYATGSRFGIQALVNSAEDEYYIFATGRPADSTEVTDADGNVITTNIKRHTPYFQKIKYGRTVYTSSPETLWSVSNTHWDIDFEDGKIVWTATADGLTWSESYEDPELTRVMEKAVYPVSAFALGDGVSKIDNIAINYGKKGSLCTDNGDGTVKVSVSPYSYKRLLNSKYMSVVIAYYSAEDELVHAEIKKVTDMYNTAEFTVDKTVESSAYGKVFVFDGSVLNNRLLSANSNF